VPSLFAFGAAKTQVGPGASLLCKDPISVRRKEAAMLKKKVEAAMNDQLQKELQSAYVYLGMSAWAESQSLPGSAAWLRRQFDEEQVHALKFYNFIIDRRGRVLFQQLDAPPSEYASLLDVFERALDHEKKVTVAINELYDLVAKERDFASQAWLDWFATEQVEEEKTVGQIVDDLRRIGDDGNGIFILDKDLGTRMPRPVE
jgi:ferritin